MKNINTLKTFLFTFSFLGAFLVSSYGPKKTLEQKEKNELKKAVFKPSENDDKEQEIDFNIDEVKSETLSNLVQNFDHKKDDIKSSIFHSKLFIEDNENALQSFLLPIDKAIAAFGKNSVYNTRSLNLFMTKSLYDDNQSFFNNSYFDYLPNLKRTFSHETPLDKSDENNFFHNKKHNPLAQGVIDFTNDHPLVKSIAVSETESMTEENEKPMAEEENLAQGVIGSANGHPLVKSIAVSETESMIEEK